MADIHDEDEAAIRQALAGDDLAWSRLVEKYRVYVYRLAWRVTLNEDDAMDAVQDTFLKIATGLRRFERRGTFRSWLTTIAMREAVNVCRQRAAAPRAMEPQALTELADQETSQSRTGSGQIVNHRAEAGEALDRQWQMSQVQGAMEELSPQQRAIIILGITNDLGPAEIARQMDLPANQVRSQWSRAVGKLRQILNADADAPTENFSMKSLNRTHAKPRSKQ